MVVIIDGDKLVKNDSLSHLKFTGMPPGSGGTPTKTVLFFCLFVFEWSN